MIRKIQIEPGQTRSEPILLGNQAVTGFLQPFELETPTALHMQVSNDLANWLTLEQNGSPLLLKAGQQFTSLDPALTRPFQYIRIVTGLPGAEIAATAGQGDFQLVVEPHSGGGPNLLNRPLIQNTTIPANQSQSGGIQLWGFVPVAVVLPAAWTAAPLSFLINPVPGLTSAAQEHSVYSETGEYVIPSAAASLYIGLDHCLFLGMAWLRIRSGTADNPVNQLASREIRVIFRVVN